MKKNNWSKRVQKVRTSKKKAVRSCLLCGKKLLHSHGLAIYCGNARLKIGCAFEAYKLRNKQWRHDNQYWKRPNIQAKNKEYSKTYYQHTQFAPKEEV